jgi:DNA (cytosine-5)-methyltransferase 1
MKHIGLFEGIGGFSLAARWMGWKTIAWCEWNEFGQKVLKHHFPKAAAHGDITKTDFTIYRGQCDIVTGGFPCQPYSLAGKRKGKADDRHLWPEMCRAIREIQPTWVVGENVFGLVNWDGGLVFNEVQADLEAAGYEVFPYVLPAVSVNAPHRRDRIFFVAYNSNGRIEKMHQRSKYKNKTESTPNPNSNGQHRSNSEHEINTSKGGQYAQHDTKQIAIDTECIGRVKEWNDNGFLETAQQAKCGEQQLSGADSAQSWWRNFPTQSPIRFGDDGISTRLDSITFPKWRNESIKAAGNAIVPQVAFQIFKTIKLYNEKL